MALHYLHFLQPDEAMPVDGSTDDWGGNRLWKDKQAGRGFAPEIGPEQLRFIRRHAAHKRVTLEEARRVLLKAQVAADCHVERIFEEVRHKRSHRLPMPLPSRQRCMWLFDASLEITTYAATVGIARDRTLVKIAPMEGSRVHLVRMSLLGVVGKEDMEIADSAEQYWDGLSEPELDSEVLLEGPFRVLGIETRR